MRGPGPSVAGQPHRLRPPSALAPAPPRPPRSAAARPRACTHAAVPAPLVYHATSPSLPGTHLMRSSLAMLASAAPGTSGGCGMPGLSSSPMRSAAARPNTTMSSSELAPRRLAPCTLADAHSPAAKSPGTVASWLAAVGHSTSAAGTAGAWGARVSGQPGGHRPRKGSCPLSPPQAASSRHPQALRHASSWQRRPCRRPCCPTTAATAPTPTHPHQTDASSAHPPTHARTPTPTPTRQGPLADRGSWWGCPPCCSALWG